MQDSFYTISEDVSGEFKDRGSKFLAYARSVATDDDIAVFLTDIKKIHNKARHHCYAYRLGVDERRFRANDDGEPSGTAGRPILGQIDAFGLTNVMVIVVRYFGGTKLGTSGLIQAYRESTRLALDTSERVKRLIEDRITIRFDYAVMSQVMNAVKKIAPTVYRQDFGEVGVIEMDIRQSETEATMVRFKALVAGVSLEEAAGMEALVGVEMYLNRPS